MPHSGAQILLQVPGLLSSTLGAASACVAPNPIDAVTAAAKMALRTLLSVIVMRLSRVCCVIFAPSASALLPAKSRMDRTTVQRLSCDEARCQCVAAARAALTTESMAASLSSVP